jgi:sec-independent protein translocase protein TatA
MAFGLGGTEVLIIVMAALFLFFGGKKLPELAKGLGRAMGEFQKGRQEFEREMGNAGLVDKDSNSTPGSLPPSKRVKRLKVDALGPGEEAERESRVVAAARALGIPTEGKSDDELRAEIARIIDQPTNAAAK